LPVSSCGIGRTPHTEELLLSKIIDIVQQGKAMVQEYSAAFSASDRTFPILAGQAGHPDIRLAFQQLGMEEIFQRQTNDAAFDIAECTLGSYLIAISRGEKRLTALPVPLNRRFRQDQIYVAAGSPFHDLSDLAGARFGLPEFQATPTIWLRSLLRANGVRNDQVHWVTYRPERVPIPSPATRGSAKTVVEGLLAGEIDAGFLPTRLPVEHFPLDGKGGRLRRLLADPWAADRAYFRSTGFFPIGTVLTLRTDILGTNPNFAHDVYEMFLGAKADGLKSLLNPGQLAVMNPFLLESLEQSFAILGADPWPYGFKRCWAEIDAFMGFMQEDGLLDLKLSPEAVFHDSTLNT
jgi:4,5-dihydroxyphthalate decarboxylase